MTPTLLRVFTPGATLPAGYTYDSELSAVLNTVNLMLTSGLSAAARHSIPIHCTPTDATHYSVNGTLDSPLGRFTCAGKGRWDETARSGALDEFSLILERDGRRVADSRWHCTDWQWNAVLGTDVPGQVLEIEDAERRVLLTLVEASIETRPMESLTALPEEGVVDPIRGQPTYTGVEDHRPSTPVLQRLGQPPVPLPPDAYSVYSGWLRVLGWTCIVLTTGALVVIRLRQAK